MKENPILPAKSPEANIMRIEAVPKFSERVGIYQV